MTWLKTVGKKFLHDYQKIIDPKKEYWDGVNLLMKDVQYAMVYSERTSGKTFFFQGLIIYNYHKRNKKTVYLVRVDKNITKSKLGDMFNVFVPYITKLTDGVFNNVKYYGGRFYLCRTDGGKIVEEASEPFMTVLALNVQDSTKSVFNDNNVDIIWFEEFMTRERYLTDEFLKFQGMISTVVRLRDDVQVIMTANTVNRFCPYFAEMGLTNVRTQQQGTIDVYSYGSSDLHVAVEYTEEMEKAGRKKPSNVYFAFDNPRLEMVKTGAWEIASYPHPPWHTSGDETIVDDIWLCLDDVIIRGCINYNERLGFVYMLWQPTDKHDVKDILIKDTTVVYMDTTPITGNHFFYLQGKLAKQIMGLAKNDRLYYSDNTVGEVFNSFLKKMQNCSIIRG